jgi:hypothetical protein
MSEHKLKCYANGEKNPPITMIGKSVKNLLITLAILQSSRRHEMKGKHYVDSTNLKPLKLNLNNHE